MKIAQTLFALTAAAAATLAVAPASAGIFDFGNDHGRDPGHSSSGGGDPTSVPEPSDAVLLGMGVVAVAVGRRLHARAQRRG